MHPTSSKIEKFNGIHVVREPQIRRADRGCRHSQLWTSRPGIAKIQRIHHRHENDLAAVNILLDSALLDGDFILGYDGGWDGSDMVGGYGTLLGNLPKGVTAEQFFYTNLVPPPPVEHSLCKIFESSGFSDQPSEIKIIQGKPIQTTAPGRVISHVWCSRLSSRGWSSTSPIVTMEKPSDSTAMNIILAKDPHNYSAGTFNDNHDWIVALDVCDPEHPENQERASAPQIGGFGYQLIAGKIPFCFKTVEELVAFLIPFRTLTDGTATKPGLLYCNAQLEKMTR